MTPTRFRSLLKILSLALALISYSPLAHAQSAPPTQITPSNDTGTNPYGSYSTDAGNVNLSNGNLSLGIPIISLPGRNGLNYALSIEYDSKIWTPKASYASPTDIMYQWQSEQRNNGLGALGWRLGVPGVDGGAWDVDQFGNLVAVDGNTLTLADGSKHYISARGPVMDAGDGSSITAYNDVNYNLTQAFLKDGTAVFGANGKIYQDTNGNFISGTDTLGRQITTTLNGSNNLAFISYKDSNGITQTVQFTYTTVAPCSRAKQHPTLKPYRM